MGRVNDNDRKERPVMADEDEGFLPRWSRRKLDERDKQGNAGSVSDSAVQDNVSGEGMEAVASPQHKELTDADMPSVDSLDEQSDYSAFMSPKVSDRLRALALRKLFHLPAYNITDGLNDYDEDYTSFAGLGNIVTHEMKRMLKRELEESETAGELPEQETVAADVHTADADNYDRIDDSGEKNVNQSE
jgi:hypothetical protein